ncbi:MAG: hypothetical protein Kow0042_22150 [Calditrichia bacterium]
MKYAALFFILSLTPLLLAQYPQQILPGQTRTITAAEDTLWVIKKSEAIQAIKASRHLELADSMIVFLQLKCAKLDTLRAEYEKIAQLNREGYIHYRDLWEETDLKLEETEISLVRWKRRWFLTAIIGTVTTGVALMWAASQ